MASFFRDRRDRRAGGDDGYALVSVIGLGTAILLSVGVASAYTIQGIGSAGSTQGFHASIQAAQAGVDQFVSRLNSGETPSLISTYGVWQPIRGSKDGLGGDCASMPPPNIPPNCPAYRYIWDGTTLTSQGRSRGDVRAVSAKFHKRSFTDYLYYSETESADPNDRFVYPQLFYPTPPTACSNKSYATPTTAQRPASCVVPTWRTGDSTVGSRVHTSDAFASVGHPTFNSRVTAAAPNCITSVAGCVSTVGGPPSYPQGNPSYANDLTMPGAGSLVALDNQAKVNGCVYYGPTRIRFENNQMRVWSPQTPNSAACGGGPSNLLSTVVSGSVLAGIQNLITFNSSNCVALGGLWVLAACINLNLSASAGTTVGTLAGLSGIDPLGLGTALAGVLSQGNLVPITNNMTISVKDNPVGTGLNNPADPTTVQCLLGSALGMYSTLDTNLTAGLLNNLNQPTGSCRTGKLFVDGTLDGRVTMASTGDILIMGNQRYAGNDDRLGMVAGGSIEVYSPLQCLLALSTCLSLDVSVQGLLGSFRTAATTGNLTSLINQAHLLDSRTVDASMIALGGRFGVQLPIVAPSAALSSQLTQLLNLNIDPPTLTVNGSVAQKHRGLLSADLAYLKAALTSGTQQFNLLELDVNYGYQLVLDYDERLRTDPPLYLPQPGSTRWDQDSFGEIAVVP